jgi:5-methylcytosine-specific restriction endonuclease McrA
MRIALSPSWKYKLMAKRDFRCQLCGNDLTDVQCEFHHILPTSLGGKDETTNLALLCRNPCHRLVTNAVKGLPLTLPKAEEYIKLGVLLLPNTLRNIN